MKFILLSFLQVALAIDFCPLLGKNVTKTDTKEKVQFCPILSNRQAPTKNNNTNNSKNSKETKKFLKINTPRVKIVKLPTIVKTPKVEKKPRNDPFNHFDKKKSLKIQPSTSVMLQSQPNNDLMKQANKLNSSKPTFNESQMESKRELMNLPKNDKVSHASIPKKEDSNDLIPKSPSENISSKSPNGLVGSMQKKDNQSANNGIEPELMRQKIKVPGSFQFSTPNLDFNAPQKSDPASHEKTSMEKAPLNANSKDLPKYRSIATLEESNSPKTVKSLSSKSSSNHEKMVPDSSVTTPTETKIAENGTMGGSSIEKPVTSEGASNAEKGTTISLTKDGPSSLNSKANVLTEATAGFTKKKPSEPRSVLSSEKEPYIKKKPKLHIDGILTSSTKDKSSTSDDTFPAENGAPISREKDQLSSIKAAKEATTRSTKEKPPSPKSILNSGNESILNLEKEGIITNSTHKYPASSNGEWRAEKGKNISSTIDKPLSSKTESNAAKEATAGFTKEALSLPKSVLNSAIKPSMEKITSPEVLNLQKEIRSLQSVSKFIKPKIQSEKMETSSGLLKEKTLKLRKDSAGNYEVGSIESFAAAPQNHILENSLNDEPIYKGGIEAISVGKPFNESILSGYNIGNSYDKDHGFGEIKDADNVNIGGKDNVADNREFYPLYGSNEVLTEDKHTAGPLVAEIYPIKPIDTKYDENSLDRKVEPQTCTICNIVEDKVLNTLEKFRKSPIDSLQALRSRKREIESILRENDKMNYAQRSKMQIIFTLLDQMDVLLSRIIDLGKGKYKCHCEDYIASQNRTRSVTIQTNKNKERNHLARILKPDLEIGNQLKIKTNNKKKPNHFSKNIKPDVEIGDPLKIKTKQLKNNSTIIKPDLEIGTAVIVPRSITGKHYINHGNTTEENYCIASVVSSLDNLLNVLRCLSGVHCPYNKNGVEKIKVKVKELIKSCIDNL